MKYLLAVLAFMLSYECLASSQYTEQVHVVTASGDYQATTADHVIIVKKASDEYTTVTLPATPSVGDEYIIKDGRCIPNEETGLILGLEVTTGDAYSYEYDVDKSQRYVIVNPCGAVTLVFDGDEWQTLNEAFW